MADGTGIAWRALVVVIIHPVEESPITGGLFCATSCGWMDGAALVFVTSIYAKIKPISTTALDSAEPLQAAEPCHCRRYPRIILLFVYKDGSRGPLDGFLFSDGSPLYFTSFE